MESHRDNSRDPSKDYEGSNARRDLSYNPYTGNELQEEGEKILAANQGKLSKYEKEQRELARKRKQDQKDDDEAVKREAQYFGAAPAVAQSTSQRTSRPRAIDEHRAKNAKPGEAVPATLARKVGSTTYLTMCVENVGPESPVEIVLQEFSDEAYSKVIDHCVIKGSGHHDMDVAEEEKINLAYLFVFNENVGEDQLERYVKEVDGTYLGWGYRLKAYRHTKTQYDKAAEMPQPRIKIERPWKARKPERQDRDHLNAPIQGREHLVVDLTKAMPLPRIRAIHAIVDNLLEDEERLEVNEHALRQSFAMREEYSWWFDCTTLENAYYTWLMAHGFGANEAEERKQYALGAEKGVYKYHRVDDTLPVDFIPPYQAVHFQYLKNMEGVRTDPSAATAKYDIEDQDEAMDPQAGMHLDPVQKAEFHDLLRGLSLNAAQTGHRYGGYSAVTACAIKLASRTPKDIVELYCLNVTCPLKLMQGMPNDVPFMSRSREEQSANLEEGGKLEDARHLGLMAISDLLESVIANQINGGPNRYPELFYDCFREYQTFYDLGRLMIRGEGKFQFSRHVKKIKNVLRLWNGQGMMVAVFSQEKVAEFMEEFKRGLNDVQAVNEADWQEW
ncbi:hypothetical protein MBLNU230_g4218t1 [Neophaeotheca triangularis]